MYIKRSLAHLLIFVILVFLAVTVVYADMANGLITRPIARTDGTLLPQSEIAGYNVYVDGILHPISPLNATATSFSINVMTDNAITLTTIDTEGRESPDSIPVSVSGKANPEAPTFTIIVIINKR